MNGTKFNLWDKPIFVLTAKVRKNGAADRIRTCDHLVRSQITFHPYSLSKSTT